MINDICEVFAPSGYEAAAAKLAEDICGGSFDEIYTDNTGNLIAHRIGTGKRVCIECGMDSKGVMVVSREDNKLFFAGVGGIEPTYLIDKKIIFSSGAWGIVRCDSENRDKVKMSELYTSVDDESINIGDFGVVSAEYCENKAGMFANGLADRAGFAVVISALENVGTELDLTVVFSAQKRLGARGIRSFFGDNEFDCVLTVDSCGCGKGIKCGEGCAVVAKDKRCVSDVTLRRKIEQIAEESGIRYKTVVTDENLFVENISIAGSGAICLCICVPVEYKGKGVEYIARSDFENTVGLVRSILKMKGE